MDDYTFTKEYIESKKLENDDYVFTVHYRGQDVDVFMDDYGQQYYIRGIQGFDDYGLGSFNPNYEDEITSIVDHKIDTIAINWSDKYYGIMLSWFNNGGHRDIQLTYKMRVLHIFLTDDDQPEENIDVEELKNMSNQILDFLTASANPAQS